MMRLSLLSAGHRCRLPDGTTQQSSRSAGGVPVVTVRTSFFSIEDLGLMPLHLTIDGACQLQLSLTAPFRYINEYL